MESFKKKGGQEKIVRFHLRYSILAPRTRPSKQGCTLIGWTLGLCTLQSTWTLGVMECLWEQLDTWSLVIKKTMGKKKVLSNSVLSKSFQFKMFKHYILRIHWVSF